MKELLSSLQIFSDKCPPITKDANNPFFKSKYATLDSIQEHIKPFLKLCDLVISQPTEVNEYGTFVRTYVYHVPTGQFIFGVFPVVTTKATAQDYGSAVSYAKRYSLTGLLNITIQDEDDDGNTASSKQIESNQVKAIDDIPWLNENHESWNKIVEALKNGVATIADVRKKFKISKAIETKLLGK